MKFGLAGRAVYSDGPDADHAFCVRQRRRELARRYLVARNGKQLTLETGRLMNRP